MKTWQNGVAQRLGSAAFPVLDGRSQKLFVGEVYRNTDGNTLHLRSSENISMRWSILLYK